MQEKLKQQRVPVKMYQTSDRLMVTAPMPGVEPDNIVVEVTDDGHLTIHGDLRAMLKDVKVLLVDEWSAGAYHRELELSAAVNGEKANVTYGNGVLSVAFPISQRTLPARLTLERVAATHGRRKGNSGHPPA